MTFSRNLLVEAVDYNSLIGQTTSTNPNEVNAIWGVGTGNKGYGQTPINTVAADGSVSLTQWQTLINTVNNIAAHQNSSIATIAAPTSTSDQIAYKAGLTDAISTIYLNRANAKYQGDTTQSLTTTNSSAWKTSLTFTQTITFASGDAARYFFNAGGQIAINVATNNGDRTDAMFYQMTQAFGTIVLGGNTAGQATIVGTDYTGISKVGGTTRGVLSINQNLGYFGLSTLNQIVYKQGTVTTYHGYTNSSITVYMKTNGTQGVHGDNGNIITVTVVWEEIPAGIYVAAGTSTTITLRKPSTVKLQNTWGTIALSGSVTGS